MHRFTSVRHVLEALLTALGVVFGLIPDPTRRPIEVPVRRDHP